MLGLILLIVVVTFPLLIVFSLLLKTIFNYRAIKEHEKNPQPTNGIGFVIDRKNKEVLPTKPPVKVPFE